MIQEHLNDRQRAFLMISVLRDRSGAADLISFLSPQEQAIIGRALEMVLSKTKAEKQEIILDELKKLAVRARRSFLSEMNPEWILNLLKNESPRMLATILRYLPGEQVHTILENLPASTLQAMPAYSETFSLDPDLVQILKRRFEQNFVSPLYAGLSPKRFTFDILHLLPAVRLKMLFVELGLCELAMAFSTLNEKTVNLLFGRLSNRDATLIKMRMDEKKEGVSEERMKKAQSHLMSLDVKKEDPESGKPESGKPETLILEMGFFVFSKAVLPENLNAVSFMVQKFSMKTGNLLQHYVDKSLPTNSEKTVVRYRQEIMASARLVTEEGEETGNARAGNAEAGGNAGKRTVS